MYMHSLIIRWTLRKPRVRLTCNPTLKYSEQLKVSVPALSEDTAKDLAHSLSDALNNMFKAIFNSNGDSGGKERRTGRRKGRKLIN